ncbi:MAG: hypothetical protein PHD31_01755 [Candidatus Pacebacteria bacterium]|nr:hypothetical protein [Candidatus Paceibacterota bacterium]
MFHVKHLRGNSFWTRFWTFWTRFWTNCGHSGQIGDNLDRFWTRFWTNYGPDKNQTYIVSLQRQCFVIELHILDVSRGTFKGFCGPDGN